MTAASRIAAKLDPDLIEHLKPRMARAVKAELAADAYREALAQGMGGRALHAELTRYFRADFRRDVRNPPPKGSWRWCLREIIKEHGGVPSVAKLYRRLAFLNSPSSGENEIAAPCANEKQTNR
jgi:hypothetical protein